MAFSFIDFIATTRSVIFALICALSGCAFAPLNPNTSLALYNVPQTAACLAIYTRDDELISLARVGDGQYYKIPGYPFLRTTRFTSALRDRLESIAARSAWIKRLAQLDAVARHIEHRNLADRSALDEREITRCRTILIDAALSDQASFEDIRARASVPDSYRTWARALGLYPLSSWLVLHSIDRLHNSTDESFSAPVTTDDKSHQVTFGLTNNPIGNELDKQTLPASYDSLGIPEFAAKDLATLFRRHAPIWAIGVRSQDDRIGIVRHDGRHAFVVTERPIVYTDLSYTIFAGEILTQLNYTIWFRARPRQGFFDILGGSIDGITWRVTLDANGQMLFADAMHNCGCYYMAFPTPALQTRDRASKHEEPVWVAPSVAVSDHTRTVIHVSSGAHYIERVDSAKNVRPDIPLIEQAYDELRSLKTPHQARHSMFEPNGLVNGTERAERWLLWPMGIASAGAMRQQGHHPIAFVGRRHFDDPTLLETYFEYREP